MSFTKYLETYKQFLFSGTGGVGKTTLSASWAMEAASEGHKVALMTIDPSRRLGAEFGMDIKKDSFKSLEIGSGQLDVHLLQPELIIRDFIVQHFSEEYLDKLSENKIFHQVLSKLSDNQSLSTIYKLGQLVADPQYDRIVIDTPPAEHTVDFFLSPQRVKKIFKDNLLAKAFLMGDKEERTLMPFGHWFRRILSYLTGEEFVAEMVQFFGAIHAFQEKLVESAEFLEKHFRREDLCYLVVGSPDRYKMSETLILIEELYKNNLKVNEVIINRAYPGWYAQFKEAEPADGDEAISLSYKTQWSYYRDRSKKCEELLQSSQCKVGVKCLPEVEYYLGQTTLNEVRELLRTRI